MEMFLQLQVGGNIGLKVIGGWVGEQLKKIYYTISGFFSSLYQSILGKNAYLN